MKKKLPILENVKITAIAAEGKALARVDDRVVFVPYVVPGDVADLQVRRKKHNYMEAVAIRIHHYSADRATPFCPHYGECGGCKWQCLKYQEQLKWKQQQVVDNLTRIGKIDLPHISPIIGSAKTQAYRNKLEFGFSNRRWLTEREIDDDRNSAATSPGALGFHVAAAFDKILDITQCNLMPDINNTIRNEIRRYALAHNLTFYDLRQNRGLLRSLMLRDSNTGQLMLLVQFRIDTDDEHRQAMNLMQHLSDSFPQITSLLWVDNHKCNDTFADQEIHTYRGTDYIFQQMEDLRFKVGPKSFYQTNTDQAYTLYQVARHFAGLTGNELVYDLYTGTGTIANFVSRQARQVIGIEYVVEAIDDARVNSEINHIDNTLFFAGDMKDILTAPFIERHGRPDVVITDPPRAGMHADVVGTIMTARPERIVYISCNPATQARDLGLLNPQYKVTRVQPVDMFPHTVHVENVVLLEHR